MRLGSCNDRLPGRVGVALAGVLLFSHLGAAAAESPAAPVQFEADVVPILRAYCWKCHGGEGLAADLDLRSFPLLLRGGKSGAAIQPGSAEQSRLYQKLAAGQMPPGDELKPTADHLATLRRWLDQGAAAAYRDAPPVDSSVDPRDRQWWAFQPPVRPPLPKVKNTEQVRTPLDAFILQRLETAGLHLSPPADSATLVRRLYLDLIGLPPAPEQVDAFVANSSPAAFDRLVDELLASPQYGERWGRHWLDAAGYVDTIGTDNDASIIEARDGIWKYRDYVIRSLNQDKPFDRFLVEQLAGDELVDWRQAAEYSPEIRELLIATGFLRQAADTTYAPELNTADIRHQVLYDTVQILSSNLLGLTLHCAQCHDHKFDPLSQADFYRFAALLAPAYDVQHWRHSKERRLVDVSRSDQAAIDAANAELERQAGELRDQVAAVRQPFQARLFAEKLEKLLPEPLRADTRTALATPVDKRSAVQKYLADNLRQLVEPTPAEVDAALDEPARQATGRWNEQIQQLLGAKRTYGHIQAIWEQGAVPRMYVYRRGDFQSPGSEVAPGVPAVLDGPDQRFELPVAARTGRPSSGYRTALANWLTQPDHPLTSRVFVNRVWQQFFGRGIVATPDNFGLSGASPTHPELLDWLATEFVAQDWSLKQLHRVIVRSSVYQQSSRYGAEESEARDPENLLLGRMPLRRLESEAIRDCVLAVSGALDLTQFGPPIPLRSNADGSVEVQRDQVPPRTSPDRRSLYLFSRRNYQLTELNLFDQPIVAHNCTRRQPTAVVLQSLVMLNGSFIMQQAENFAARIRFAAGGDTDARIDSSFRTALGRAPDDVEADTCRKFLQRQADHYREQRQLAPVEATDAALVNLCQMLLNTNEFLYVP